MLTSYKTNGMLRRNGHDPALAMPGDESVAAPGA